MQKMIFGIALLLFPLLSFGQFRLTADGMVSADDPAKDYIVVEFPHKTQADLFDLTKSFLMQEFNSGGRVLSENAPSLLTAFGKASFEFNGRPVKYEAILSFKYTVAFKEGRVKISFDVADMALLNAKYDLALRRPSGFGGKMSCAGVFNTNGKVFSQVSVDQIEAIANILTSRLIDAVNGVGADDDW